MNQEERILKGVMYSPGDSELRALKLKSHLMSQRFSALREDQKEERETILRKLFAAFGQSSFIQGPLFVHYGIHTRIGRNFFGNYNLTIQDDAEVTIGDRVNFGPNVSIVTPVHPLVAEERWMVLDPEGNEAHMCYAKPVIIGDDVWIGANVTVCGGVRIGRGCVIGAGSVVTHDMPENSLCYGVPCKAVRAITREKDSMRNYPGIMDGCQVKE